MITKKQIKNVFNWKMSGAFETTDPITNKILDMESELEKNGIIDEFSLKKDRVDLIYNYIN